MLDETYVVIRRARVRVGAARRVVRVALRVVSGRHDVLLGDLSKRRSEKHSVSAALASSEWRARTTASRAVSIVEQARKEWGSDVALARRR